MFSFSSFQLLCFLMVFTIFIYYTLYKCLVIPYGVSSYGSENIHSVMVRMPFVSSFMLQ